MVEQSQTRQGAFVLSGEVSANQSFPGRSVSVFIPRWVTIRASCWCDEGLRPEPDAVSSISLGPPAPGPWLFSAVQIWQPKG